MVRKAKSVVKEEGKKEESPISKKEMTTQFYWILGVMILLVVVIIAVYLFVQGMNRFNYNGLAFDIVKQGELKFYHYSHYFVNKGKTYDYNLYLREDPRKNNVPIDVNISLPLNGRIFLSINTSGSLESCGDTTLAVAGELSPFLINHFFNVSGAVPDRKIAEAKNLTYKTCKNRLPSEAVILIQSGEKTEVTQQENGCYVITSKDCEIISAVEKFEVEALLQAKSKAETKSNSLN